MRQDMAIVEDSGSPRTCRSLFISDVHFGTRGCQAERLLDFLREYDADTIYLVGDIVDGWALSAAGTGRRRTTMWCRSFCARRARARASSTCRAITTRYCAISTARISAASRWSSMHFTTGADGRRYLVTHGDQFDLVVQNARWLALLGDKAYDFAIGVNRVFNMVRRRLGFPYWSFSKWAKLKVKNAVNYIGDFERTLTAEAREISCRRGHLRAHPSRGGSRAVRRALSQLRRLGGELHGDRRASRRPVRDRHMDRRQASGRRSARNAPHNSAAADLAGLASARFAALPSAHGKHSRIRGAPDGGRCRTGRAPARRRRAAHAARFFAGARRRDRRARLSQGRDAPAHRLVQVPRRLQQALLDRAGEAGARRRRVLLRQSRAGRRARRKAARHAVGHRDAGRCAAPQARAHRRVRRRGRAVRSQQGGPRGDRARARRKARRNARAAL